MIQTFVFIFNFEKMGVSCVSMLKFVVPTLLQNRR